MVDSETHWQQVYSSRGEQQVSWFEETPALSIELLQLVGATPASRIIDVGGGASHLVDVLLDRGFRNLTVLDVADAALATARARLGGGAGAVTWIAEDIRTWLPEAEYDVWHDRAALHFLIDSADQAAYVERVRKALPQGGHAIIGTFAPTGPEKCSGLPVIRHSSKTPHQLLGREFALVDDRPHAHRTPWGAVQEFQFSTFRRS